MAGKFRATAGKRSVDDNTGRWQRRELGPALGPARPSPAGWAVQEGQDQADNRFLMIDGPLRSASSRRDCLPMTAAKQSRASSGGPPLGAVAASPSLRLGDFSAPPLRRDSGGLAAAAGDSDPGEPGSGPAAPVPQYQARATVAVAQRTFFA